MPRAGTEGWRKRSRSTRGLHGSWEGKNLARVGTGGRRVNIEKRRGVPGGGRAGLDKVAEDPEDLLGIGNDGKNPHLGTAAGTAQGIDLVDL
jgi:hypothetical protein